MSESLESAREAGRLGRFVAVCGLPGVGKTTVAEAIADRLDGRLLRTDAVRKELYPDPEYTDEETARVYDELLSRARETATDGRNVVLDGTFYERRFRDRMVESSRNVDASATLVKVECEKRVVRDRIARRDGLSDADFEVHELFEERFEPVERDHVVVDNSDGLEATHRQVERHF